MNYYDTLIEIADDCPATKGQVPQASGGKKTKALVEYELLLRHRYTYTEEDIAFAVYAALHEVPKSSWPKEREKFLQGPPAPSRVGIGEALRVGNSQGQLQAAARN